MKSKLCAIIVVVIAIIGATPLAASAAVQLQVQVNPGDTVASLSTMHNISAGDLLKSNPQLNPPYNLQPGDWINLPGWARTYNEKVFTISAPSNTELKFVTPSMQNVRKYRMNGREFRLGTLYDKPVLVYSTGGGMENPTISVTLAATRFNQDPFCYIGIGGAGHGVDIGDSVVATGVIPGTGHGNLAPLQTPEGRVTVGQFWSYYGEPVITASKKYSTLLLSPDPAFLSQVKQSVQKVQLPAVNKEVSDYVGAFFGTTVEPYVPDVHFGWTVTGPFVTSEEYLTQLEERSANYATTYNITPPQFFAVDMEDYHAIHALVSTETANWCVIRTSVDLARQVPSGLPTPGVPWDQANDPSQPWAWQNQNNQLGWFSNYNPFYEAGAKLVLQIVADYDRAAPAAMLNAFPVEGEREIQETEEVPFYLQQKDLR